MTEHRYPCQADPYPLIGNLDSLGHRHACIHDAVTSPRCETVEHRCECGMTWTATDARPAPDLSWLTPQPPETWLQRQPVWRILAAVFSGITLFFAAMIAIAVATGAL